jgi:methionyl-tRNA synthetase
MSARVKLITTPIFYVNAAPHIGHLSTLLLADACARWQRMRGAQRSPSVVAGLTSWWVGSEVLFVTGTDEHGAKIERAARSKGMETKRFCDEVSETFRTLATRLGLSNDIFIRTTEQRHRLTVERVWSQLWAAKLIQVLGCIWRARLCVSVSV